MNTTLIYSSTSFKLKEKFLLFVLLLAINFSYAQTPNVAPKTVEKEFIFKVYQVIKGKADTILLVFDDGGKYGIKKGDQGKIYGIYNEEKPNRSQKELGY